MICSLKRTLSFVSAIGVLSLGAANAATTFVTTTGGNAAALDGHIAGSSAELTLSAGDGGGTIGLNTIGVFRDTTPKALSMTSTSMGVENEKWGTTDQRWIFSFDQAVDFDALGFSGTSNGMILESAAWKDDASASGSNWSFSSNGTVGTFSFNSSNGPTFDFTGANVSSVAAGTEIKIQHASGAGGAEMTSFTITPIPEPSAIALTCLGGLALILRRRR